MLNKCIDIFQFLLEAVPPSIQETHLVLLYAKSLDSSDDASIKFRAQEAYGALWNLCKGSKPSIANADKYKTYKEWCDDPITWFALSDMVAGTEEPIVARNGFDLFRAKVAQAVGQGKEIPGLGAEMWLRCAQNSAAFQDFETAIEFGQKGLEINRLHKETRAFLSQNSPMHQATFDKEKDAVRFLSKQWLERCFTSGYRKKVKAKVVTDLEEHFETNRFDMQARESLAYYAKDKWRAKFLFESECAAKIQICFKEAQERWRWQAPIRMKLVERATGAYRAFMKDPLNRENRDAVLEVTAHRFCSKKHIIRKLVPILEKQAKSIKCIAKSYKAYSLRRNVRKAIAARHHRAEMRFKYAVIRVQRFVRKIQEKMARKKRKRLEHVRIQSMLKINAFVFKKCREFESAPRRAARLQQKVREDKARVLQFLFMYHVRRFQRARAREELEALARSAEEKAAKVHTYPLFCLKTFFSFMLTFIPLTKVHFMLYHKESGCAS